MSFQLLQLPGAAWVETPDSAALSIEDNLDLRVRATVDNWRAASRQTFISKLTGNVEWSLYLEELGNGWLQFVWADTDPTTHIERSGVGVDFDPGTTHWVRVRREGTSVTFYTSDDDTNDHTAVVWTQLGSTQTTGAGAIDSSQATHVTIGAARTDGQGPLYGYVHVAVILDDTNVVADPAFHDSSEWTVGDDAGDTGSDGVNTWTLGGEARIIGDTIHGAYLSVQVSLGFTPFFNQPNWTDITDYTEGFDTDRGRSRLLERFTAGMGVIRVDNSDGRFDPNNSSSPYSPNLKIGTPIRVVTVHENISYTVFRGSVEEWPLEYHSGEYAAALIRAVDLTRVLARYGDLSASYPAQTTDERITAVLDDVGWDDNLRDIDEGVGYVQALTVEAANAFDVIQAAADVEVGHFYIAADGTAVFRNRISHAGGLTSQATFGAANIHYEDLVVSYNDDDVRNQAKITRDGGVEQTAEDQTAIDDLGYVVTHRETDGHHLNDNYALNSGEWVVGRHKDPRVEVRGLTFLPGIVDAWPTALGVDLRDAVTVNVDPPGGGTDLSQVCVVEAVRHHLEGLHWETTYTLKPISDFETVEYWTLGTSDELDTDTILA